MKTSLAPLSLRTAGALCAALIALTLSGCTSRGLMITSIPAGAEVSINRRVVGRTPIRVGFEHYGTYRIELRLEKFQTLVREENLRPPIYGYDPAAFFADNAIPARLNDEVYLHYILKPLLDTAGEQLADRDALVRRAELARAGTITHPFTGVTYQVVLRRETPTAKGAGDAAAPPPLVVGGVLDRPSDSGPTVAAPAAQAPIIPDINAAQPQAPRIAQELGVIDTRPAAAGTEKEKPPEGPTVTRPPVEEELIYNRPRIIDNAPAKKPAAKSGDKPADKPAEKPGDKPAEKPGDGAKPK